MGLSIEVSALNKVLGQYVGMKTRVVPSGTNKLADILGAGIVVQEITDYGTLVPFPIRDIVAWRDGISTKYSSQLKEALWWDEDSAFGVSEDISSSAIPNLLYVAARVDKDDSGALQALVGSKALDWKVAQSVIDSAAQRGFASRFPQILLGVDIWLPFQRNMIIEEPDPRGNLKRFGSLAALALELEDIRAAIRTADPAVIGWISSTDIPEPGALAAAFQCSDVLHRICTTALARHLPLIFR